MAKFQSTVLPIAWIDEGKPYATSVKTVNIPAKIRTRHLLTSINAPANFFGQKYEVVNYKGNSESM
jgi:hypothetical protein